MLARRRDQTARESSSDRGSTIGDAELVQDPGAVIFNRLGTKSESDCDFLAGRTFREQLKYLALTLAERLGRNTRCSGHGLRDHSVQNALVKNAFP